MAKRKSFRLPNGYGSIVKLSGNRRNPYMARITNGYNDKAQPIYSILGYYATREAGLQALAEYNHDPYDVDMSKLTFKEVYDRWSARDFPKMGDSLVSSHKASYKHCTALYKMEYRRIRAYHMQACIDGCGLSYATQANIKNLFAAMDKFAFECDVINKQYSSLLTTAKKDAKQKTVFSTEEIRTLWDHQGEDGVDETLFMLYTGMRVTEMLTVENANIDLKAGTLTGGIKSEAGKNRVIPIHAKIRPIIERHMSDRPLLFGDAAIMNQRGAFSRRWDAAMALLGTKHTTHECRHTFRSKLDSLGANKVCIDLIMGHKSTDVGERVYTHKTLRELKSTIDLLDYGSPSASKTSRVSNA